MRGLAPLFDQIKSLLARSGNPSSPCLPYQHLRGVIGSSDARERRRPGRQRNGGAEDVVGIVIPLGLDESLGIAAVAFRHPLRILPREEIRISTRKRHPAKGLKSGSDPLVMPLLFEVVRPIGEVGEDLDEHMVTAQAEGACANPSYVLL